MSVQQVSRSNELSEKAQTLLTYLRDRVEEEGGEMYMKGKFIADDVGLSAKEIGALILQLQDANTTIEIEKWSYTSATTWRISN